MIMSFNRMYVAIAMLMSHGVLEANLEIMER